MKIRIGIPMLCAGALLLFGCGQKQPESAEIAETTTEPAVTTSTLPHEYAENELTTAAVTTVTEAKEEEPSVKYQEAKDLTLNVKTETVRPYQCSADLTNNGEMQQKYTFDYRVLYGGTEKECDELPEYKPDAPEERTIEPAETRTLKYDWNKRYGQLPDGDYTLEILLEAAENEDGTETQLVCRAPFAVISEGYVPKLHFETVSAKGVTLIVENAADAGRSYCFVYRVYDSEHNEVMRVFDKKAQLNGISYVKAGETMTLQFDWSNDYGHLPKGDYTLELELIADGEKEGKSYSVPFTIN